MTGPETVSGPVYLVPTSLVTGPDAGHLIADGDALPLAGSGIGFQGVDLVVRAEDAVHVARYPVSERERLNLPDLDDRVARLTAPRDPFAGLDLSTGPYVMGIVNVTPDSFSDGGQFATRDLAIAQGRRLMEEGADILDIGGESTRPGAAPVSEQQEIDRVIPVIETLVGDGFRVSVDTRKASVMAAALAVGAAIVNDVSALSYDAEARPLLAGEVCPAILMHMRHDPGSMQNDPRYAHAPTEVYDELGASVAAAVAAGIRRGRLMVDPGFGFAKTPAHNVAVTAWLALLHGLGCPILYGASRKSTIARLSRDEPADARLPGSLALALSAAAQGAQILRVHDVAETRQALTVYSAVATA